MLSMITMEVPDRLSWCPIMLRKLQERSHHFRFHRSYEVNIQRSEQFPGRGLLCHLGAKAKDRLVQQEWLQKV